MRIKSSFVASMVLAMAVPFAGHAAAPSQEVLKRGEYLIRIGGCNDCHTPAYGEKAGKMPTAEWLTGVPIGYRGPWGTTYAANLRLSMAKLTEDQWLLQARLPRLPPMPFWALADMTDADLRAVYHFVRSLGPAGVATPAAVLPGGRITTPVIDFVPRAP